MFLHRRLIHYCMRLRRVQMLLTDTFWISLKDSVYRQISIDQYLQNPFVIISPDYCFSLPLKRTYHKIIKFLLLILLLVASVFKAWHANCFKEDLLATLQRSE